MVGAMEGNALPKSLLLGLVRAQTHRDLRKGIISICVCVYVCMYKRSIIFF